MRIKDLFESNNKILIHDIDVDGICSASLFLKLSDFKRTYLKNRKLDKETVSFIIEENPEFLIFLDLPIDQDLDELLKIKKTLSDINIVVIDHHIIHNNLNKYGILHINPRLENKDAYIPTSLLAFWLLEKYFDMEKYLWISCIGTIADYGHKTNPEFIERCKEKFPEYLKEENIFETSFGIASKTIYSALSFKGEYGMEYVIKIINKSKDFIEFFKNPKLKKWRDDIDREIKSTMNKFEKEKEVYGDLIFFVINTKAGITSIISNLIAEKYPDKAVIVAKDSDDGWKISARSHTGKFNVSTLMEKSSKGIGHGGGHPKAAGASVFNIEKFKKRLINALSS